MRILIGPLVFVIAVACTQSAVRPRAPDCEPGWQTAWSADSGLALCVPPAFARGEGLSWQRGGPGGDFFSIDVIDWPADSNGYQSWPPRLASSPSGCEVHCITVDSLVVHSDRVAGAEAQTDVGLVTVGAFGFQRTPMFKTWWVFSANRRGFAQGWARNPVTLDTLRQALSALQVGRGFE
jgi:hypothetical protein